MSAQKARGERSHSEQGDSPRSMCLLSISKLSADNIVFVEFYADSCFVKDKVTKKVVLQGKLENGLYQLQIPDNVAVADQSHSLLQSFLSTSSLFKSPCNSNVNNPVFVKLYDKF